MTSSMLDARTPRTEPGGWRARLRLRRRLDRQDRLGAQLAELARIRDLLGAAREVVAAGWVQGAWFVCPDRQAVDLAQARRMTELPVAKACLVGAILHAHGALSTADDQIVQRTFDLTWHTLRRGDDEPVRWCPAPPIRAQHLLELVRWNDQPGRARSDVESLLVGAAGRADAEIVRHRQVLAHPVHN